MSEITDDLPVGTDGTGNLGGRGGDGGGGLAFAVVRGDGYSTLLTGSGGGMSEITDCLPVGTDGAGNRGGGGGGGLAIAVVRGDGYSTLLAGSGGGMSEWDIRAAAVVTGVLGDRSALGIVTADDAAVAGLLAVASPGALSA